MQQKSVRVTEPSVAHLSHGRPNGKWYFCISNSSLAS